MRIYNNWPLVQLKGIKIYIFLLLDVFKNKSKSHAVKQLAYIIHARYFHYDVLDLVLEC